VKCPFCGDIGDKVVDSRESREGDAIRRRRQCLNDKCRKRFTSYERIEEIPYMVVKKDGTRERFERSKLVSGLLKACEKRPIKPVDIDDIADRAEQLLNDRPEREISGRELGALVMSELKKLDQVAYVRFASVYRDFRDVDDFAQEIRALKGHKE
jgi:transcriptional repressor NrdR